MNTIYIARTTDSTDTRTVYLVCLRPRGVAFDALSFADLIKLQDKGFVLAHSERILEPVKFNYNHVPFDTYLKSYNRSARLERRISRAAYRANNKAA